MGRAERCRARKPTLTTLIEGTIGKGQSVADKRRNRGRWVVLLLAASALLAVGAVLWGLNNAERRLTAAAEEALAAVGLPVTVEVSGRDAILSGEVDADDQTRAIELVRGINGIRQVEWESLPTASATTTTGTVETTVTSTVTSVDTSRPPTTSTTAATGTTTTDVSVLPGSEGDDAGAPPQLPLTGSEFTVALVGIVALLAGTLLVRRARGWEFRDRRTSERLATLKGLTAVDGSEIEPRPAQDPPKHK